MKQINISVSFDDEKLRALNKYLKKKELTAEDELAAALLHLYEKHVPAAVREYIDEDDAVVPVSRSAQRNRQCRRKLKRRWKLHLQLTLRRSLWMEVKNH